jgi:pyruvate formate lyase activating enzyme
MLAMGRQLALEIGLNHIYAEKGLGEAGRTTYCATCSTPLIERDIWALKQNHLHDGACPHCHTPVAGHW